MENFTDTASSPRKTENQQLPLKYVDNNNNNKFDDDDYILFLRKVF